MMLWRLILASWFTLLHTRTNAFHDCIQASVDVRKRRRHHWLQHHRQQGSPEQEQRDGSSSILEEEEEESPSLSFRVIDNNNNNNNNNNVPPQSTDDSSTSSPPLPSSCAGGLCIGMSHGPHQGGNASYPVAWNGTTGTSVRSYMTVPAVPKKLDGITYYIWTDVFLGDGGLGRMNQFVPQLILGSVLDGSSGPPHYYPEWHVHDTWMFGAHYFFEIYNPATNRTKAHAAYGTLHHTRPGEVLYTTFELSMPSKEEDEDASSSSGGGTNGNHDPMNHRPKVHSSSPRWTLTMGVLGDNTRISTLMVDQPYMGIQTNLTNSWLEAPYHNMCINACWELYGAKDAHHLPSTGSRYELHIHQPLVSSLRSSNSNNSRNDSSSSKSTSNSSANTFQDATLASGGGGMGEPYPFTTWEQDEGNGMCPSSIVRERHCKYTQEVLIDITVAPLLQNPSQEADLEA